MTAETETQAAMLTAVASHLTHHPHLCPINILSDDRLQLRSPAQSGRVLVEWADTLTDPHVDVHAITHDETGETRAFVYIVGHLDDLPVSVWDVVPGLVGALGPDVFDATGHVDITVGDLRAYSQDGTAPTPVGSLAHA